MYKIPLHRGIDEQVLHSLTGSNISVKLCGTKVRILSATPHQNGEGWFRLEVIGQSNKMSHVDVTTEAYELALDRVNRLNDHLSTEIRKRSAKPWTM